MNEKERNDLFTPIKLGRYHLKNRIVMAPMTRMRAGKLNIPTALMAKYYSQRAAAGLIITEASQVSPQGVGYPNTPGIYSEKQTEAWKQVTDAVHQKEGKIFIQLWHVGRISHPSFHNGKLPVAPSAIAPKGKAFTYEGMKDFVKPRALDTDEIPSIIEQYGNAAKNALAAGFDGVEIHSANGYLLDQFLRNGTNKRTDKYGGSLENRSRLTLDVIRAAISVLGADRVAVRISPSGTFNDMYDSNPKAIFGYLVKQLNGFNLAYLHIIDALEGDIRHGANIVPLSFLRNIYKGTLMINGGYDQNRGNKVITSGNADLVSFGKLFISNPDLPNRFSIGAKLTKPDESTFYGGSEKGYTDYAYINKPLVN